MKEEIKIPLSKNKIALLFLLTLLFVFLGIWFASNPEKFITGIIEKPNFIRIAGIVSVVFFGSCSAFIGKKLLDKKAGLIIDKNGITDNSNATSVGLIQWTDITGIREIQEYSQKFIILDVSNPDHYIDLKKNSIGKMATKANHATYGSPISITANSLKIDYKELKSLLEQQYEKNAPLRKA